MQGDADGAWQWSLVSGEPESQMLIEVLILIYYGGILINWKKGGLNLMVDKRSCHVRCWKCNFYLYR